MLAAAITGALGLGQSLLNNAAAQQNFNEQMAFSKYQYEDMKKYNSWQNQVAQMRAAGVNPALAIGQGQLGHSASGSSVPSAPSFQQADLNPMASAMVNPSQARLNDAQALGVGIDNETRALKNGLTLSEMMSNIEKMRIDIKEKKYLLEKLPETWLANYNNIVYDTSLKAATAAYNQSQANLNDELLKQAKFKTSKQEEQFRKDIDEADSRIYANYHNAMANGLSAAAAMQQAKTQYENFMHGYDGMKVDDKTRDNIINEKLNGLRESNEESRTRQFNNLKGSFSYGIGSTNIPLHNQYRLWKRNKKNDTKR